MSYVLNEDQRMMRDVAARFAREELFPIANEIDATEQTPAWVTERCAELGFLGIRIPEEFGGIGADLTTACLVIEEIAKASPAFAGVLSVEMILCPGTVNAIGTQAQKERLLPPSAKGQVMAFSQSEPAGAGNIMHHQTRLTPEGNGYVLNGHKLFCTQGQAKTYLVFCKTERDGEPGYGCVIVEGDADGFSIAPYEEKLGWRGTNTGSISFTDIKLTKDDVLGDILTANQDILPVNEASVLGHAASSLGCLEGMFDLTLDYVKQRTLYDEPMHRLSPISDRLATIKAKMEAARCLLYASCAQFDDDQIGMLQGSVCKSFICETAFEGCTQLLQMWGGSGIMNSTGVNRYMRDARTKTIAEGATEMHNAIIAASMGLVAA